MAQIGCLGSISFFYQNTTNKSQESTSDINHPLWIANHPIMSGERNVGYFPARFGVYSLGV